MDDKMTSIGRRRALVTASSNNLCVKELPVKKLSLWVRLLPILFFFTYLNFTVFLFACGPWPWPVTDGTKLYTFLAFAHLALLMGHLSAAFGKPRGYCGNWKIERVVVVSLVVNILLLIPTAAFRTGSVIPDIVGGLSNPGAAYALSLSQRQRSSLVFVEYIRILMGPLLFLLLPLTVYHWQRLKLVVRRLATFSILSFIAIYVAMGTNKAIADLVLQVPWMILGGYLSGFLKIKRSRKVILIASGVFCFLLFLSFFTSGQRTRSGSGAVSGYFPATSTYADPDNFLVRSLPRDSKIGAIALTKYLTQGYYALYLSLEEPFVPMFGVGNSMFLFRNAARLTGIKEIEEMSYPMRIGKYGWNAYRNWVSIYPWIASDVSFPGTILVVFLIGRFFALSWLDVLKGNNPFAVAAFAQFLIMLFYFPANNQVLQQGESLVSFYAILVLWLFTRRKYVWRKRSS